MKANELMIDDWVYNKNIAKPMQIYPTIFSQMFRSNPNATTEDYNIFPIPLTPEILEKNGFVKGSYVGGFYSHWCPFRIYIAERVEFSVLFDEEILFTCTYIHQLQHALRLCGIEKEIVL